MGTRAFPLAPIPDVIPSFPVPVSTPQAKFWPSLQQTLTSKSLPHIVPRQLAQQILFSSFPNTHQISLWFCCSAFLMHKPALRWPPLPDSSLCLLSQPHGPPSNSHTSEPSSSQLSLLLLPRFPRSPTASHSQFCSQLVPGSVLQLLQLF